MAGSISDISEYGHLVAVAGAYFLSPEERGPFERFDEYVFQLDDASFAVTAVPDDDTVTVEIGGATLPFVQDLTGVEPWTALIGCGVVWLWRLTNHRGYFDGCQIEFGRPGEFRTVQFVCEASSLSVRSLSPLCDLSNQHGWRR